MKASVLLLTLNEAANLPRCLEALAWCDDILVLDSGSTDATVHIALAHGARVLHRPFDDFARQRNYGLQAGALRNEWVLHLDADEVVTPTFAARLVELAADPAVDAYRVPSKTMLLAKWLRHSGMYPAYQVRLGRRDRLRFKQVGHGQREDLPPERVATFDEPYLHYTFSHGFREWLEKHLRYAADEARLIAAQPGAPRTRDLLASDRTARRRALKGVAGRLPLVTRPLARFFYVYVLRRGFLDGAHGAIYALMLAVYEGMIAILAFELTKATDDAQVSVPAKKESAP
jgi:glycosyltransferase involved in cell wall biosynthesis